MNGDKIMSYDPLGFNFSGTPSEKPPAESVHLDAAEDLEIVRVLVHLIQGDTDSARDIVRRMSPRDRAVFAFLLREAGRLVDIEDSLRDTIERRTARETHPDIG